jgi:hypothetical protein
MDIGFAGPGEKQDFGSKSSNPYYSQTGGEQDSVQHFRSFSLRSEAFASLSQRYIL